MEIMNAVKLGSGPSQGGAQTIYAVNGIIFILIDYPPGIEGAVRQTKLQVNKCYESLTNDQAPFSTVHDSDA
jgi:hypothetical protein